ncbi:MAG: Ig-like domain-containing protein [Treponema sp.]|nr:Ig-like domain-containing protein [Treponema sp.]
MKHIQKLRKLILALGIFVGMGLTAYAEDPYAALKNTTTPVKFDNKDWYLINYDNDTVTLLSKECVGASVFGSNNTYSGSTVESYVNNWYDEKISSDAKTAVSGNGAFLLSSDDVTPIPVSVRACSKASGAEYNTWWLSSPIGSNVATIDGEESGWNILSQTARHKYGVRPALKLDLSSVIFDSQSNEFTVNIKVDVTGVTLNKTAVTLNANGTETLTATVAPDNATDKTITWSSDNTAVATVSNGVVTAVAEGTATITVTATNGTNDTSDDKTATCAVTVASAAAPISYITAKADPFTTGTYYATFYDSTTSYVADCEVYYATANADGRFTLEKAEGNVIKAGEGVILKATSETVTLTQTDAAASYDSLLTGSDTETTVENALVLSLGKNGVWFYKYSGTLGANKAYLAQ